MIFAGMFVKHQNGRRGEVLRVNWSDQAEVRWEDQEVSMCNLNELKRDITKEGWRVKKPKGSKIKLLDKIKNAWSVLLGKSFVIRWYEGD